MGEILDSLSNAKIMELAQDIRVLIAAGILLVLAIVFRWKTVLLLLVGFGGTITVIRYTNIKEGAAIDANLGYFALGTTLIFVILIYLMFIRSD